MSGLAPVSFKTGRGSQPRLSTPFVRGRRHERYWSEDEERILRETYPTGGAEATRLALAAAGSTARQRAQIFAKAHSLGVAFAGTGGGVRKRRTAIDLPADIDDRIRAGWAELKGRGAVNAFADRLGVPRWWLSKRAVKLGLSKPHSKEPPWSEAETLLMSRVPLHDPHKAALIFREHGFRRTPAAIVVRAKRLDLSRRYKETLSARGAARILGIDDKAMTLLCIDGRVAASRRSSRRLVQQGGDPWSIRPEDLRRYILDNLEMIDIRRVEKFAFVAILTSPQPEESSHAG